MAKSKYIRDVEGRPPGGTHSARRVGRIAELMDAKSYLEVGVFRGTTFNCLNFPQKVAVDPKFGFDTSAFQEPGVEFRELTSDDYFIQEDPARTFDIMFLDGLHTFTQTFRDFCNSLTLSHDKTVWLIDDVMPIDVFSAWPVPNEARDYRRRAGGTSGAWHGDVYKMLYVIHDYFPTLSYLTINTRGNPQAVIWKSPRKNFKPAFKSLEEIERIGYFDYLKLEKFNNAVSEETFIDVVAASLGKTATGAPLPPAAPAVGTEEAA